MKIIDNYSKLIGNTPLFELKNLTNHLNIKGRLLAKLEFFNPSGSVKDRAALSMIDAAEKSGALKPGATIIEPTSGNTGIALAAIAAGRGYKVILTMPETMSPERRRLLSAYGAELVLTPGSEGMSGAILRAGELLAENPGSVSPGQFSNPANPAIHLKTTGPEIWESTGGDIDIFISCAGTGGTVTGTGAYLKSRKPSIKVVVVEPDSSPVLSGGLAGPHGIQGIGAGFIPDVLDTQIYDSIERISDSEAFAATRDIARYEGLLAGISSGAALAAAARIAASPGNEMKTVVMIFPDTGERYLSTGIYDY